MNEWSTTFILASSFNLVLSLPLPNFLLKLLQLIQLPHLYLIFFLLSLPIIDVEPMKRQILQEPPRELKRWNYLSLSIRVYVRSHLDIDIFHMTSRHQLLFWKNDTFNIHYFLLSVHVCIIWFISDLKSSKEFLGQFFQRESQDSIRKC